MSPRGFWTSTTVFGLFLFAGGAPTALYSLYADQWGFSSGTLTIVFGVYALALLGALLGFGDLSDAIGRKPVVLVAMAVLVVSLVVFIAASGVAWLLLARLLQGFATGLLTAAASAAMLDQEPRGHPGLASLANVGAAMGGQALGTVIAGVLVEYAPMPTKLIYVALIAATLALAVAVLVRVDETVARRQRFKIRVHVAVASSARPAFLAASPCLIATWALSSLYLSLGPNLSATIVGSDNRLVDVSASSLLLAAGTIAAICSRRQTARRRMLGGCAVLTVGSSLTVVALATLDAPTFYFSTLVAGLGFGTAFSGALQTLTGLARPEERAALVSAIYIVAYLSFSIPAIIAGAISTQAGLVSTALGYSAIVAALALAALIATQRTTR